MNDAGPIYIRLIADKQAYSIDRTLRYLGKLIGINRQIIMVIDF